MTSTTSGLHLKKNLIGSYGFTLLQIDNAVTWGLHKPKDFQIKLQIFLYLIYSYKKKRLVLLLRAYILSDCFHELVNFMHTNLIISVGVFDGSFGCFRHDHDGGLRVMLPFSWLPHCGMFAAFSALENLTLSLSAMPK